MLCSIATVLAAWIPVAAPVSSQTPASAQSPLDCGYRPPSEWMRDLRAAVAKGEIPDPAQRKSGGATGAV